MPVFLGACLLAILLHIASFWIFEIDLRTNEQANAAVINKQVSPGFAKAIYNDETQD
jgi:hypothetical protein